MSLALIGLGILLLVVAVAALVSYVSDPETIDTEEKEAAERELGYR